MKKRLPIVIFILVAGVAGFLVYRNWKEHNRNGRLTFTGNIELTEVRLAFKRPGRLLVRAVDEGDSAASGSLVARLETDELMRQRDRAVAAVSVAESRLTMLSYEIEHLEQTTAAAIEGRQAELRQAEAALEELETGSREQEIAEAEAAVDRARTESENAATEWRRVSNLRDSGVVSQSAFDSAKTRDEAAKAALKQATERLDLIREGPRSERISAARAAVERAKAALRTAQAAEIELKRKRLERGVRGAEMDAAEAELGVIETQLADSILYAPFNATVLIKSAEPGEVLAAGTPVVTLGDLEHPWVRAYVAETDLGRVKLGDSVRVKTDSFPGKFYEGRISFIASEAEFTPKQIQTREERTKLVYRIKVDLPNPNQELKLNMPVEGEIVTGRGIQTASGGS